MENLTEKSPERQNSQRKGVLALAAVVVALVLVVLGLVTAYYFQGAQALDLQHKVDDLKASAAEMDKQMAKDAMGAAEPAASVQYREIPELGVKYKLTDETKGLTYYYSTFSTKEEPVISSVGFSTVSMSAQKQNDLRNEFPCTSHEAPSGSITRYSKGDIMIAGAVVKETGKKIGSYYYIYSHPQFACSLNNQTIQGLQSSIDAVKAAYDSLEAM